MKINAFAVITILLILFAAGPAIAKSDGCYRAEKDAAEWGNGAKFLFFGSACLLGPVGLVINIAMMPSPEQGKLVGKSSAYVAEYASCYKRKTFETASMATTYGCTGFLIISVAAYFIIFGTLNIFSFNL